MPYRALFVLLSLVLASAAQAQSLVDQPRTATALRPLPKQPLPVFDECTCTGTVFVRLADGSVQAVTQSTPITDVPSVPPVPPRDTCPSGAQLNVEWHSEPRPASGFRYKLVLPGQTPESVPFTEVAPSVRTFSADLGTAAGPGRALFILGARGSGGDYADTTRTFQINYSPDTWWSGPDRDSPSLYTKANGEKYALLVNGLLPGPIMGSLMSADSVNVLPALRPTRRTFFEVWKDTVWVRQEGDTVHLNSWVILHNGGHDRDSPYAVKVSELGPTLPGFPGGPVMEPGPANGSAIGFRSTIPRSLTPIGQPSRTALSGLYPIFDEASVFHLMWIAGYHRQFGAGRAFAVAHAEDGDGDRDRRVVDARELVLKIENGTATPYEQSLRPLVLTYEVDFPPFFVTSDPLFSPGPQATFTTHVWDLRLLAADVDPFLFDTGTPPGGPSAYGVLRRRIKVHGKDAEGNDFTYVDPLTYINQTNISIAVPAALAPGPCRIEVELCDCQFCEDQPGAGRCVVSSFPVTFAPAGASLAQASVKGETERTWSTALLAPYPNPTPRGASIPFTLARSSEVAIEIYDLSGHRVRSQVESLPAGSHSRTWLGTNEQGRRVAAGLYFVRLKTRDFSATRKLLVAP